MANGKAGASGGRDLKRALDSSQDTSQPNEPGKHAIKRSRVSRACDQCRSSREKCDGTQPTCHTCQGQNRACSYNEQPKKRGIQPNYIRTLELTLAWLLQNFPEAEARLSRGLPLDDDNARRLIGGADPSATEALWSAWRDGVVNRQLEQMLSGTTIEISESSLHPEARSEQRVDHEFSAANLVTANLPPQSNGQDAHETSRQHFVQRREPEDRLLKLPENAWMLLEYYFAFTHSWLPMTEKHSIFKLIYSYPPGGVERKHVTVAEHAELWAIMALAATQVLDEDSSSERDNIREVAEKLIPIGNSSYQVPHIRAMILLALDDVQKGHMLAAWLRTGTIVRLLTLFKLLENLGSTEKFCKHVHLVAFILESALAVHLKAPGHFRVNYIEAIGSVSEDGLEEYEPWIDPLAASQRERSIRAPARSFSTLNTLVRMCMEASNALEGAEAVLSGSATTAGSVVFALLQNASLKQNRAQPFALLAQYRDKLSEVLGPAEDLPDTIKGVQQAWTSPTGSGTQEPRIDDMQAAQQDHAFMSIPNESNNLAIGSSPELANAGPSTQAFSQPTEYGSIMDAEVNSTGATDIFDELEFAMLERKDSNTRPQFMENLGFAADLDLAEFFGADYQPSDPFLAYMNFGKDGGVSGYGG